MTALLKRVKRAFEPMPDDMTSTKYHIEQIERRRDPNPLEGEIVRAASEYDGVIAASYNTLGADGPFCPLN